MKIEIENSIDDVLPMKERNTSRLDPAYFLHIIGEEK